jgi:hypothetical protein
MRRKTFDTLMATGGLVLAIVLLAAGGMLTWAHGFVHDQVTTQLSAQHIVFPEKGSESLADPAIKPYLTKYAGQELTTGVQARAYADHFIAVHLEGIGGGKTYSELSAAAMASPDDQKLAGQVATTFKGETLRGMLLNAYAFDTMATVAGIAALVAFGGAGVLLLLSILGFVHARRTDDVIELGGTRRVTTPAQPVSV